MKISTQLSQSYILVTLSGRIDPTAAQVLRSTFDLLLQDKNHKFIINMQGVELLSSAAMRTFLELEHLLEKESGSVLFEEISDEILQVIELAGFLSHFPCSPHKQRKAQ